MNEFERISLEFDIALENSDSMMDMIYSVLSIEGNNIYLKESSGEVDEEELDDMYIEAAGKFMEKARKLFDTIIEAIKKFFTQLSTAIKTKIRQSQINKKLDDIEKNLANAKTKELKKKGHTADPRKLVVLYKQFTKDMVSVITKYYNDDDSNVEDLKRELHAIETSDKYKDFSLEELDIMSTSIKENINFTKSELRNMDKLGTEIQNISISAEEKLKEYATKANNSNMVNAIHSAGTKIASTGKKVGKLAYDHPLLTTVLLVRLYTEVQPYIIHGVEKIYDRHEEWREEGKKSKKERKHEKLKDEVRDEILKSRYGVNFKDLENDKADAKDAMKAYVDFYHDNDNRRVKYGKKVNDDDEFLDGIMKDPKLKNEYRKNIRSEAHKVFNDAMSFADEFEKEIKKEKNK